MRNSPVGHYFDVITNGFGAMQSYAARIEPQDRWAVIAYIRALQLSRNASPADVPADKQGELTNAPDMATQPNPFGASGMGTSATTQGTYMPEYAAPGQPKTSQKPLESGPSVGK